MCARQPDGSTLRDHLQSAAAAGRDVPELALDVPPAGAALWQAFVELSGARTPGAAVHYSEIESWQRLHGVALTPWEVGTICAMDRAVLAAAESKRTKQ